MKRVPRVEDLPVEWVEALESGDLEQIQPVIDGIFEDRRRGRCATRRWKETVINTLRWLAVLPAAMVAAWVAWIFIYFTTRWAIWGFPVADFYITVFETVMGSVFSVVAFIAAGAKTAPNHQLATARVLVIFSLLAGCVFLAINIHLRAWWEVVASFSTLSVAFTSFLALFFADFSELAKSNEKRTD